MKTLALLVAVLLLSVPLTAARLSQCHKTFRCKSRSCCEFFWCCSLFCSF